jgi:hypothetical protein
MKSNKTIGILFVIGAIGVFVPYTILTITFNYPDILREEPDTLLRAFNQGGPSLIFTWLAFALMGFPLLVGYALLGKKLETDFPGVRWLTTIGVISGIVQIVGLLRWVFVVPVLATDFVNTQNAATQSSIIINFKVIHQFGGVLLGEHLGQLFTIIWTVGISYFLLKSGIIARWVAWLGILSSGIYLLAQADLFATVIPGFPVWEPAGFAGSTLWLLWLIITGIQLTLNKSSLEL